MDNAQKAIMIGVGLFITIIVIAAVMLITGIGQDIINKGTSEASSMSDNLIAQLTSEYDGTTLTGSQVIQAVKQYYTRDNFGVFIKKGNNIYSFGKVSSFTTSTATTAITGTATAIGKMTTSGHVAYVQNSAKYTSSIVKDSSGAVVYLLFTKN